MMCNCKIMLIERLTDQNLDDRLPAHVQFFRRVIQLLEHRCGEIHIHPLNRPHHATLAREEPRDILSFICKSRDSLRRQRPLPMTSVLQIRFLAWDLPSAVYSCARRSEIALEYNC